MRLERKPDYFAKLYLLVKVKGLLPYIKLSIVFNCCLLKFIPFYHQTRCRLMTDVQGEKCTHRKNNTQNQINVMAARENITRDLIQSKLHKNPKFYALCNGQ